MFSRDCRPRRIAAVGVATRVAEERGARPWLRRLSALGMNPWFTALPKSRAPKGIPLCETNASSYFSFCLGFSQLARPTLLCDWGRSGPRTFSSQARLSAATWAMPCAWTPEQPGRANQLERPRPQDLNPCFGSRESGKAFRQHGVFVLGGSCSNYTKYCQYLCKGYSALHSFNGLERKASQEA